MEMEAAETLPSQALDMQLEKLTREIILRMLQGLEEITPQLWRELFEEDPDKAISFLNGCVGAAKFAQERVSAAALEIAEPLQRDGGLSDEAREAIERQLLLL